MKFNCVLFCYLCLGFSTDLAFAAVSDFLGLCKIVNEQPSAENGDFCPDLRYIQIYLFTRNNRDEGQFVEVTETSNNITLSYFNSSNPNKMIAHGHNSNMSETYLLAVKDAYLRQGETNVWMFNYESLVSGIQIPCYPISVSNIKVIGKCLSRLVKALVSLGIDDIHMIGHSLGAQVLNYVANALYGYKVRRITGLEPAGPLFLFRDKRDRLDSSDAIFVDAHHTNMFVRGTSRLSGDVDVFYNGGVTQPNCDDADFWLCDHTRVAYYYAESINFRDGFVAKRCKSYLEYSLGLCRPTYPLQVVGDPCPPGINGTYFLYTNSESPYGRGNSTDDPRKTV